MEYKFEDLVSAINQAHSEFDLTRLSFEVMKQGLVDLQKRLLDLESKEDVKTR
jgi:hypothetical protein